MRASRFSWRSLRESPADTETISHQLMLRAGLVRPLAAGIYSWLPLGLRALRKVEAIVREEMEAAGAVEVLLPSVHPAELWRESGRLDQYGPLLLRFHDRHQRLFCYGPTHEEVITDLVRQELHSYRQLPINLYQIQTKFRDEMRPRSGVMRGREFVMKDAYSFHLEKDSLQKTYDVMYRAYARIFQRIGLRYRIVRADSGEIGGEISHEFHVLADSGEDVLVYAEGGDYAANMECATAAIAPRPPAHQPLQKCATPEQKTIAEVSAYLQLAPSSCLKVLLVAGRDEEAVALVLRGDHQLNLAKVEKLPNLARPLRFIATADIRRYTACDAGSIGPVGLSLPLVVDSAAAACADFCCGANSDGWHLTGVNWQRDLPEPEHIADFHDVLDGEPSPDGEGLLRLSRGIEVGHIFQLGDKYSRAMGAHVLDDKGRKQWLQMGCYGIGISRIVAAAIEQCHDQQGIVWPLAIAPFEVALLPLQMADVAVREAAELLYMRLQEAGIEVFMDDRSLRPGVSFADADLLGLPHRIIVSARNLRQGMVEYRRRNATEAQLVPIAETVAFIATRLTEEQP